METNNSETTYGNLGMVEIGHTAKPYVTVKDRDTGKWVLIIDAETKEGI